MSEKMKKLLQIVRKAVDIMCCASLICVATTEMLMFLIQICKGSVDAATAIFAVCFAALVTVAITETRIKASRRDEKETFKEYRMKMTAAGILFVSKAQLTERELKKFLSLMRYVARENDWEE